MLSNASAIRDRLAQSYALLSGSDDAAGAVDLLGEASNAVDAAAQLDPALTAAAGQLLDLYYNAKDVAADLIGRLDPRPERQRANRSHRETGSGRGFLPRMRQRHEEGPHHQGRPAPLRRSRARRRRGNRPPPTRRLRLHQAVITKTAGASLS